MAILGLAGVLFCKMRRHRQNGLLSFVLKKILTCVPKEATGDVKAITGKRLTTLLSLYSHSFLLLSVSFSQTVASPARLCSNPVA